MRARTAVLLLVLIALGIFAALNWPAITTPTSLNFVVARVDAPLGMVLLGVTALVTILYALFLTWVETAAFLESRRLGRELQMQRQLAESAEASRYTALEAHVESSLASMRAAFDASSRDVIARVGQSEEALRGEIERAGNTLAAYFEELEDRLNRGERPAPPR
jgi:uncharacterized integral membrane protein